MGKKIREMGKYPKTITFDRIVLEKLKQRAKETGSNVSSIVNYTMKQVILTDSKYYEELAKYYNGEFHKALFMKEQAETKEITKENHLIS